MSTYKGPTLSKDVTIYNYTLLKRVKHAPWFVYGWWLPAAALLVWEALKGRLEYGVVSFLLILLLHSAIRTLILRLKTERSLYTRRWSLRFPWFGPYPMRYASLTNVSSVQLQLFFIALVLLGCLYPWLSRDILTDVIFFHLWLTLPRLYLMWTFRSYMKKGYLLVNDKDTSCYAK